MQSDAPLEEPTPAWTARATALLTGVTALAAQLVWIRALGRAVGTTTESLAAVTGVFLAGLGVGAWLGGRRASHSRTPGRDCAGVLLGAALLVLASPWLFGALPDLHLALLRMLGTEPGPSPWPALLLALPLLLVPTTLMGMGFPLLVAALRRPTGEGDAAAQGPQAARVGVGGLYALNTLGALLGVLVTVPALPWLGERLTLCAAAGLEALAALLAFGLRARRAAPAAPAPGARTPAALRLLLCVSGLTCLAAEVAAFRLLEPFGGPHLWGVVLLLGPVLAGIALGSALGGARARRAAPPTRALTGVLLLAGLFVVALVPVAGLVPRLLLEQGNPQGGERVLVLALASSIALLPAMVALGACFPLAVRAARLAGGDEARASGDLGAWNAAGSLAGSLLAGFVLLPLLGATGTLLLVASVLLAAAPLWHLTQAGERRVGVALAAALPLVALGLPAVRARLEASGPRLPEVVAVVARRPPVVRGADGRVAPLRLRGAEDVRLYGAWFGGRPAHPPGRHDGPTVPPRDGRMGTVALLEEPGGHVRLRVNGLSEAQLHAEEPDRGSLTEVALGLLPVLAHPAPRRGLVIGHGAGWTAEAALATDLEHVDVAELDATVLDMVELYRGHPLAARTDPKARLWLTDGRLLLRRAARGDAPRYDVIASQPSHPWVPGAGHLFTLEAYQLARAALTDDGVFAQWINLFEMTPDLLRSALATFRAAFPRCWVFHFHQEALLLGFAGQPRVDAARWSRLLEERPAVGALAGPLGLERPGDLWRRFLLDEEGIERIAPRAGTPVVVDDRPVLELGLAWRVLTDADTAEILAGRSPDLGAVLLEGFPPDFARALPDEEARGRFAQQAIDSLLGAGDLVGANRWDGASRWPSTGEARLTRAALARARGDELTAERLLREAVAEDPMNGAWVAGWIGMLVRGVRERPYLVERALEEAGAAAARLPEHGEVRARLALLRANCGDLVGAQAEYEAALRATRPPAPPSTTADLARLLLVADPEDTRDAPVGPELGSEMHALALLRTLPEAGADLEALELRTRLEARLGDDLNRREAEQRLAEARARAAREARRAAWSWLTALDGSALGDAQRAVELEPTRAEGHELVALALLQRALASGSAGERRALEEAARGALGTALREAHDRPAALRRAQAMLRWFSAPADGLVPAADE